MSADTREVSIELEGAARDRLDAMLRGSVSSSDAATWVSSSDAATWVSSSDAATWVSSSDAATWSEAGPKGR